MAHERRQYARSMTIRRALTGSLALSLALATGLAPATALAADGTGPTVGAITLSRSRVVSGMPVTVAAEGTDAGLVAGLQATTDASDWTPLLPGTEADATVTRTGTTMVNAGVLQVALTEDSTCVLLQGGSAWCWGANDHGQLGDGTTTSRTMPVRVAGLPRSTAIAAGNGHVCALTEDAEDWCWGWNDAGQVGDGTMTDATTARKVNGLPAIASIGAAYGSSCAVSATTREVWCWGDANYSKLGTLTDSSPTPVKILGLSGVYMVRPAYSHVCALTTLSVIYCWGRDYYGELGDGGSADQAVPVVAQVSDSLAIGTGEGFTCSLTVTHTVECWGQGGSHQLGAGTADSKIPLVVAGISGAQSLTTTAYQTCVTLTDQTVSCWGANERGQLGGGTASPGGRAPAAAANLVSVAGVGLGPNHSCAVHTGGGLSCWGSNETSALGLGYATTSATPVVTGLAGIRSTSAATDHTCVVGSGGSVWCWGANANGALGDGTTTDSLVPVSTGLADVRQVAAGPVHTCAVKGDGTVRCWGANIAKQLGDTTTTPRPSPVSVTGVSGAVKVAVGDNFSCALLGDGTIRCWGAGGNGQLGNGTTPATSGPVAPTGIGTAVDIAAASHVACALLAGGGVDCWGNGPLGNGSLSSSSPVPATGLSDATAIAVGPLTACARRTGGTLACWGNNFYGEMGPVGGSVGTPTDVAGYTGVTGASIGLGTICARLADGTARCSGDAEYGQLGNGTRAGASTTPVTVAGLSAVADLSSGSYSTCATLADGSVRCWGYDASGQLGDQRPAVIAAARPTAWFGGRLDPGAHQVCVRGVDAAGNVSSAPSCTTITVVTDTTGPTITAVPAVEVRAGSTGTVPANVPVRISFPTADNAGGVGTGWWVVADSTDGGLTFTKIAETTSASWTGRLVANGSAHRFRITPYDAAGNAGTPRDTVSVSPVLVQQNASGVTYKGTWSRATVAGASGGTVAWSKAVGASATYVFTGRSIGVLMTTGPGRGAVRFYLDGVLKATVDTRATATTLQKVPWSLRFASSGRHTLRVVVVGTAGRPRVDLDGFVVLQ